MGLLGFLGLSGLLFTAYSASFALFSFSIAISCFAFLNLRASVKVIKVFSFGLRPAGLVTVLLYTVSNLLLGVVFIFVNTVCFKLSRHVD
jgi:hypothetical protein